MRVSVVVVSLLAALILPAGAQKPVKKGKTPDEQIKVEREYDKDGNLIRFDSLRVYNWSSDSTFSFPLDEGWEKFFGEGFFDQHPGHSFFNDSAFSFSMPNGKFPFSFFDEEELFDKFGDSGMDSSLFRNFLFNNDTSFFMGPNSSFVLPPGFFIPGTDGLKEMEKLMERHFKSFSPGLFPESGNRTSPFERFTDPDQQKEWEELLQKQEQEMKQFREKWEMKKKTPGTQKM